jgi:hypothetical protein
MECSRECLIWVSSFFPISPVLSFEEFTEMNVNNAIRVPVAFAEALRGRIVGPENDPADPAPEEDYDSVQSQAPKHRVKLTAKCRGGILVDREWRGPGETVEVFERRAYELCASGMADPIGVIDWFLAPRLPKVKPVAPSEPAPNLNQPDASSGPRRYKGKTRGTHGVYQRESGRSFVGTVFLTEEVMRREVAGRHVECDPSTPLPAIPEKLFTVRPNQKGESILVPAATA